MAQPEFVAQLRERLDGRDERSLVAAGIATSLIVLGTWHRRGTPAPALAGGSLTAEPVAAEAPAGAYPVKVDARLDEPLSCWLWLVKWFLVIPHFVVLAFLWAAFVVLTLVAWVAVLFTGRYPRGIFAFNVGVLRWNWRVQAYATAAISTDRYPPFTLRPAQDYPAELEIPYPERMSRARALVQPWLLAFPHLLIAGALTGAWNATWTVGGGTFAAPGLLAILVLAAGFTLLFGGRYPRDVFRLLVGINRWTYRAIAYRRAAVPVALRIAPDASRIRVSLLGLPTRCPGGSRDYLPNVTPPARIAPDGTFRRVERFKLRFRGGGVTRVRVVLEGGFTAQGVTGTTRVTDSTRVRGERRGRCASKRIAFSAVL